MINIVNTQNKLILDVGCGVGNFLAYMKSQHVEVMGYDLSEAHVKLAEKRNLKVVTTIQYDLSKD